jgi:hypothetical protein
MSSEWTTVAKKNRIVKVDKQPIVSVQVRPIIKTESEKRAQWEQRIKKKNEKREQMEQWQKEYDREFPLLPGSKDMLTEAQKIAYINARNAARKEDNHKAYLLREEKRKAKRAREAEEREKKEKLHVQDMIEKWGAHRWHHRVFMTDDDCLTAAKLRDEDMERYYEEEYRFYEEERRWQEEWEREQIEEKKYIEEQTANMGKEEKRRWILDYEYQKEIELDNERDAESDRWYRDFEMMNKRDKEDAERLAAWEAKNKK